MNTIYLKKDLKKLVLSIAVLFVASFSTNILPMETFSVEKACEQKLESNNLENKKPESKAIEGNSPENLETIRAEGDINNKDKYGRTPAFYAYLDGKFDSSKNCWDFSSAEELIANGAHHYSILLRDDNGRNPAFCACMAGNFDLAKKLLELSIIKEECMAKCYFSDKEIERNPLNLTDSYGQTPVFWACIEGKADLLKAFIAQSADINVVDRLGKKPINYAQEKGHTQIVEILDPEKAKKKKRKLQSQLIKKAEEKKKKNKKNNCEKEEPKISGAKAIVLAKTLSEKPTINQKEENNLLKQIQLSANTDIDQAEPGEEINEYGESRVFRAYATGQFDLVDKLIKAGANNDINTENIFGQTPIFNAILRDIEKNQNKTELDKKIREHVTELIRRGANIKHENKLGQTPIFIAFSIGLKAVITLLKENGAEYKPSLLVDKLKQNPIFIAYALEADFNTVKYLKSIGFNGDINMENKEGESPLFNALANGRLLVARKLMDAKKYGEKVNAKGNINMKNKHKHSIPPLFSAYVKGNITAVEKLKNSATKYGFKENAKGSVLTLKDKLGLSPLFYACIFGDCNAIKKLSTEILIEQERLSKEDRNYSKPDPNTMGIYETDIQGWTPVFYQCDYGSIDAIKLIKKICPDWTTYINKKDREGKTPLDVAIESPIIL